MALISPRNGLLLLRSTGPASGWMGLGAFPPHGRHRAATAITQAPACLVPTSQRQASRPNGPAAWAMRLTERRRRVLALGVGALAALLLFPVLLSPSPASASTLTDCLAQQHVCVTGNGRSLVSEDQQSQLEQQIGGDAIYLVVAPSGSAGYDSSTNQIISALNGHPEFTVGFLDSQQKHFGAYNKGMLPSGGAADIATSVVKQHQSDQDIFAALTDFVTDVQRGASTGSGSSPGPAGAAASAPSHT